MGLDFRPKKSPIKGGCQVNCIYLAYIMKKVLIQLNVVSYVYYLSYETSIHTMYFKEEVF